MTRAYLIDPFVRKVSAIELVSEPGTFDELNEIYALIDCEVVEVVRPYNSGSDVMYFDENGNVSGKVQEHFLCRLWPETVIAGNALWIGASSEGDSADPEMTISYLCDHIVWATHKEPQP